METLDQNELGTAKEIITAKALSNMGSMSPWMLLMGVLFIVLGLMMLLSGGVIFFTANTYSSLGMDNAMRMMAGFYLVSGGVFTFGGFLLVTSGSSASTFSKYPTATAFENFTAKQKNFWLLMGVNGILTIVFMIAFVIMAGRLAKLASGGM